MRRTARTVRRCALNFGAIGLGLAAMPAPFLFSDQAHAQNQPQAADVLPTNVDDYRCLVMMQDRQRAYLANTSISEAERVQVVNNLIIISAFYAGRLTHYSSQDAQATFDGVRTELAAMTADERTAQGNRCAEFYLSVIELLGQLDSTQR